MNSLKEALTVKVSSRSTIPTQQTPAQKADTSTAGNSTPKEQASSRPSPAQEGSRTSAPASEVAAKAVEQSIATNYFRGKLLDAGRNARQEHMNPADGRNVVQDPRQTALDTSHSSLPGLDRESPFGGVENNPLESAGRDNFDVSGKSSRRGGGHDPLHGGFDPMQGFEQKARNRIGERSSGGPNGQQDPNAQSDNDALSWAGLTFAGLAGGLVSGPIGVAGGIGAAVVGGLNYVYDAIIEDMDNDVPDTVDHQAANDAKVESDTNEGSPAGGDVSDETENEATLEYILDNDSTPHPDDTSGDNPNPDPLPDLNPRPSVDARDTVRTPADPYVHQPTAEELQQQIDSMQRFGPRTQNAINPGDDGGEVGTDPYAPIPDDILGEDPLGDPGSPEGPNE